MKNSNIIYFLILSLLLGLSSCRDDEDSIIEIQQPITGGMAGSLFEGSVSGRVVDDNGFPIRDAVISLQGESISTDQNGLYSFTDMQLMENQRVVLKVSKANYIETSRAFTTSKNRSIVDFALLNKRNNTVQFNSINEVNLEVSNKINNNGLSTFISIPPDAYVLDGTDISYQGNVNIISTLIDPADRTIVSSIPGDLGAIDANGEEVQLGSYSMLAVELESEDGQKLNLAEGVEASIRFDIPDELVFNAPSTIPLWHYDLETAFWNEEGSASLSSDGTMYEGTVTHFSFWNCDVPFSGVELSGRIVDENGLPHTGLAVRISILNSAVTRYGFTDSNGEFRGKVPRGEVFKVEYSRDLMCDSYNENIEIGPFENDVTLEDYIFSYPEEGYNLLSGRVLTCDGLPSPTSFVYIISGAFRIANLIPDNSGNFRIEIPDCVSDITLIASDLISGYTSTPMLLENGMEEDIVIPEIRLCTEGLSFVEINYEGSTYRRDFFTSDRIPNDGYFFTSNIDSITQSEINVGIVLLNIDPSGIEIGDYVSANRSGGINFKDENNNFHGFRCPLQDPCGLDVNIESVGEIGGYITGSFSGSFPDSNPDFPGLWDISGTFSSFRQN